MHEKPKLSVLERIAECGVESSCVVLKLKDERRMMLKLRGGMAVFQIEMGNLKVAWSEEGGEGVQGVRQWGGRRCGPLAIAVFCVGCIISEKHFWQKWMRQGKITPDRRTRTKQI